MRLIAIGIGCLLLGLSGCASVTDMQATQLRIISLESQVKRQDDIVSSLKAKQQDLESKLQETQGKTEVALKESQAKLDQAQKIAEAQSKKSQEEKQVIRIPNASQIQTALKNAKFFNGEIDGKIGSRTKEAIREFQQANQLNADGVVGSGTWNILGKYLEESPEEEKKL